MIPPFNKDGTASPLGFPMSQNRLSVPIWSYAMEMYPPSTIVELGAMNGGFTTVIGMHAWRIGAKVFSFDRQKAPNEEWESLSRFLKIEFCQCNLFEEKELIKQLIQRTGVTYLLCDNGDKPHEFNVFSQYLKPGDVIGVHDYSAPRVGAKFWPWSEIIPSQVEGAVRDNGLTPFLQKHFDFAGWLVYKKNV